MASAQLLNRALRMVGILTPFLLLALASLISAQTTGGTEYLEQALSNLCGDIQGLIPTAAMLLVIVAGVVYAAGQVFGAETRARANVWATSCLTGAIIGILISQIAPQILSILAGATVSCTPS